MPNIAGVLETSLYVDDLDRAVAFYRDVLGLSVMFRNDRMAAFDIARGQVLLLFRRGASLDPIVTPAGTIPPHDGVGPLHMAFAIDEDMLADWEARLEESGVEIEQRVRWTRGGRSVYFRDADRHLIELATPGLWTNY